MGSVAIFTSPSDPYIYLKNSVSLSGAPLMNIDVTAEEYLRYAAEDLNSDTKQGYINALGNAKRALHLMIESLLNSYGLLAKNKRTSFPDKLKLLDGAGLFSLSILHTLNVERNVMEHEYKIPTRSRVQETIDVGRLLLLATQRMREYVLYESLASMRDTNISGVVQLNPAQGRLSFFEVNSPTFEVEIEGINVTVLDAIRDPEGKLIPGVRIEPRALWALDLSLKSMDEWAPLLRPMLDLSDYLFQPTSTVVSDGNLSFSRRVELPLEVSKQLWNRYSTVGVPILDYSTFTFGFQETPQ